MLQAENTFILAVDGDVTFKPDAVRLLVDRLAFEWRSLDFLGEPSLVLCQVMFCVMRHHISTRIFVTNSIQNAEEQKCWCCIWSNPSHWIGTYDLVPEI